MALVPVLMDRMVPITFLYPRKRGWNIKNSQPQSMVFQEWEWTADDKTWWQDISHPSTISLGPGMETNERTMFIQWRVLLVLSDHKMREDWVHCWHTVRKKLREWRAEECGVSNGWDPWCPLHALSYREAIHYPILLLVTLITFRSLLDIRLARLAVVASMEFGLTSTGSVASSENESDLLQGQFFGTWPKRTV